MSTEARPTLRITPAASLVESILRDACEKRGIQPKDVLRGRMTKLACEARAETARAVFALAPDRYSKAGIARRLRVDHSSVIYALLTEEEREARREKNRVRHAERRQ